MERPRILLAGGGTGGHLFPALAIADEIRKLSPAAELLFVGTKGKIEARVVPARGYAFETIWISGFHRALRLSNLMFPLKAAVALAQSFILIKRFRPDVVVGTGGYVCGPILYAASLRHIPTVVHESNSYPGVTTRAVAKRATKVFTAFETTSKWLPGVQNIEVVGTPTRNILDKVSREEAGKFFGLSANKRTVLVFGGSLGASSINNAVLGFVDELLSKGIQLIWQTGEKELERMKRLLGPKIVGWVGPFIEKMEYAYAASDLVVCRAGAVTLAELTRLGKPAILVPYPRAAADHQRYNAKVLEEAGAATMVPDNEVGTQLRRRLFGLIDDGTKRNLMSKASRGLGKPEAGRNIARKILDLVQE
ncbi:MAG: undecaprenyldiphospho-muramoylpentapeptide beta-N-acetylglucosaminyltransferase [Bacteroidota bacterium]